MSESKTFLEITSHSPFGILDEAVCELNYCRTVAKSLQGAKPQKQSIVIDKLENIQINKL